LLVEDHFLARVALRSVLNGRFEVSIAAEAESGEQALEIYDDVLPDVTLMDLRLPGINGFETIAALRKRHRDARIVVLTNYEGSEDVFRALRMGAMAYLTKDASGDQVLDAILTVHGGVRYLPRAVRDRLAERIPAADLTPREHQVLTLITRGKSNRDIATDLNIAEKTVRIHVSSVLDKLNARDRTQAAIYAIQQGIVHLP
jgi:DNA-binding NarL/FixJ family response regulator